jgi:HK97 gp10 family phage protein
MVRVVVHQNVIDLIPKKPEVRAAVKQIAEEILADSQQSVPVDTGELKASGYVEEHGDGFRIGYSADHAGYVEFGTSEMPAQPYLRPAALKRRGNVS